MLDASLSSCFDVYTLLHITKFKQVLYVIFYLLVYTHLGVGALDNQQHMPLNVRVSVVESHLNPAFILDIEMLLMQDHVHKQMEISNPFKLRVPYCSV